MCPESGKVGFVCPKARATTCFCAVVKKSGKEPGEIVSAGLYKNTVWTKATQRRQKYLNLIRNKSSLPELLASKASTEKQDQEQEVFTTDKDNNWLTSEINHPMCPSLNLVQRKLKSKVFQTPSSQDVNLMLTVYRCLYISWLPVVLEKLLRCYRDGLEGRWQGKARRAKTPWCNSVQLDSSVCSLKPSGSLCLTVSNRSGTSIFHAGETFMDRLDIHQFWSGIVLLRGKRCRRYMKMILWEKHLFIYFFSEEVFWVDNVGIRRSHTAHFHRVTTNAQIPTRLPSFWKCYWCVFFFLPQVFVCVGEAKVQYYCKSDERARVQCAVNPRIFFYHR